MLVWKQWEKQKIVFGCVESRKQYKLLLLFGIVPIFIWISG